jgi:tRNA threonylcarbamoyladenosine biosynthesis protein TsaB
MSNAEASEPMKPEHQTGGDCTLALETSSRQGGVAVGRGEAILGVRELPSLMGHAAELLPAIDSLCRECGVAPGDIGRVFVSIGPGSFTGLRIGVTVAKMLAFGGRAVVVGVPSMRVIAHNALQMTPPPVHVAVALDAHRDSVYGCLLRLADGWYEPVTEPAEVAPGAWLKSLPGDAVLLGEGVAVVRRVAGEPACRVAPEGLHIPRAQAVHALGLRLLATRGADDAMRLVPHYVREAAAVEKWRAMGRGG